MSFFNQTQNKFVRKSKAQLEFEQEFNEMKPKVVDKKPVVNLKRSQRLVLMGINSVPRDEVADTMAALRKKVVATFRYHIGEENAITPFELFNKVYGINPVELDVFRRRFWWQHLVNIMREMRHEESLFVINSGQKLYVLRTKEEATKYKDKVDRYIDSLNASKLRADKWVKQRKWLSI